MVPTTISITCTAMGLGFFFTIAFTPLSLAFTAPFLPFPKSDGQVVLSCLFLSTSDHTHEMPAAGMASRRITLLSGMSAALFSPVLVTASGKKQAALAKCAGLSSSLSSVRKKRPWSSLFAATADASDPAAPSAAVANQMMVTRRSTLPKISAAVVSSLLVIGVGKNPASAKCPDIDSCREIGERKDEAKLKASPITRLGDGLEYKVLNPGVGTEVVGETDKVEIAFSVAQANGRYMFSKGMGYNKINFGSGSGGPNVQDVGSLDFLLVNMGAMDLPVGIQKAMVGMKRGEKRRIICPPALGFETSDWNPKPKTFRGRQQIFDYQSLLYGRGDTQPPFPSPTIWDVEVLRIR